MRHHVDPARSLPTPQYPSPKEFTVKLTTNLFWCSLFLAFFAASVLPAAEPIFVPVKIDGPAHNPAEASWWFGPFNESASVLDADGDGDLDITCGKNWYEAPEWKKHENYFEGADKLPAVWDHCLEYALDVNKDGRTDVVNTGYDPGGVVWYENPGEAGVKWKFHKVYDSKVMEGAYPLGDIDGDGDMDLLGDNFSSRPNDGVTWFESIDDEPWLKRHLIGTMGGRHGAGLGDINGDRRPDIVMPNGWYEAPPNPAEDDTSTGRSTLSCPARAGSTYSTVAAKRPRRRSKASCRPGRRNSLSTRR